MIVGVDNDASRVREYLEVTVSGRKVAEAGAGSGAGRSKNHKPACSVQQSTLTPAATGTSNYRRESAVRELRSIEKWWAVQGLNL
jgi:hypothetical protein